MIFIYLKLGALMRIENVFGSQGMKVVDFAQLVDDVRVKSINIDPAALGPFGNGVGEQFADVEKLGFLKTGFSVIDALHWDRIVLRRLIDSGGMLDPRSGSQASLSDVFFMEQLSKRCGNQPGER